MQFAGDVFALAVIMCETITRIPPWKHVTTSKELEDEILSGNRYLSEQQLVIALVNMNLDENSVGVYRKWIQQGWAQELLARPTIDIWMNEFEKYRLTKPNKLIIKSR